MNTLFFSEFQHWIKFTFCALEVLQIPDSCPPTPLFTSMEKKVSQSSHHANSHSIENPPFFNDIQRKEIGNAHLNFFEQFYRLTFLARFFTSGTKVQHNFKLYIISSYKTVFALTTYHMAMFM